MEKIQLKINKTDSASSIFPSSQFDILLSPFKITLISKIHHYILTFDIETTELTSVESYGDDLFDIEEIISQFNYWLISKSSSKFNGSNHEFILFLHSFFQFY